MKIGNKFVRGDSFTLTEISIEVSPDSSTTVSLKSIEELNTLKKYIY